MIVFLSRDPFLLLCSCMFWYVYSVLITQLFILTFYEDKYDLTFQDERRNPYYHYFMKSNLDQEDNLNICIGPEFWNISDAACKKCQIFTFRFRIHLAPSNVAKNLSSLNLSPTISESKILFSSNNHFWNMVSHSRIYKKLTSILLWFQIGMTSTTVLFNFSNFSMLWKCLIIKSVQIINWNIVAGLKVTIYVAS